MIINLFKKDGKIKIMSIFFEKNVLKQIQENESEIKEINNFLSSDECNDFIEYFNVCRFDFTTKWLEAESNCRTVVF